MLVLARMAQSHACTKNCHVDKTEMSIVTKSKRQEGLFYEVRDVEQVNHAPFDSGNDQNSEKKQHQN